MSLGQAVCCFCGKPLPMAEAVSLTIQPRIDREESQHLVAHSSCLRAQVIKDIVLITDLTD
jgi:CDP-diacylglycerol pyrophosphatase